MSSRVRFGISPCPNDTFAFHALLERRIATPGLELEFELNDIETLNQCFEKGELDASKASFSGALRWSDRCVVLRAGAALGFGVGPLLLARCEALLSHEGRVPPGARVLVPGERTTAHLLYRLFHAGEGRVEHAPFASVLPALERGDADFGVCIHESRFVWRERGLACAEDLGATWERATGAPLPLGGIVVARSLGRETAQRIDRAIRASIDYAYEHRSEALESMRKHAQELSDDVLGRHVELYVNEWTRDLGPDGCRALAVLDERARSIGWTTGADRKLEVLGEIASA
jgi:1,4-dihydroxy-6-naphthoate synthase